MYHILICDDEKDIVSALQIYLNAEGYQTFPAYTGKEALDILEKEEIHLVLMDIMMPEMDGISALVKLREQYNLPVILLGLDGSPVYDDTAVLNRWLDVTEKDKNSRSATFYNTLPLHDGNHYPGVSKTADYKARAQKFFDELDAFFTELEKSGRKVMVVVVPEHGGALKGDRMQVSGLRDIPSPSITDVPVGVKFFGMKAPHQGAPIVIEQPSSFLAISDLVVRVLDGKIFTEDNVDWKKLTSGLPQTAPVSENSNAVVIQYQDKPYVRLNGGDWVPYPQ